MCRKAFSQVFPGLEFVCCQTRRVVTSRQRLRLPAGRASFRGARNTCPCVRPFRYLRLRTVWKSRTDPQKYPTFPSQYECRSSSPSVESELRESCRWAIRRFQRGLPVLLATVAAEAPLSAFLPRNKG